MSETVAGVLLLVGPLLGGVLLAHAVQFLHQERQRVAEWLVIGLTVAAALAADTHGEGAEHGFLAFLMLSIPGLLSFAAVRAWLSARSRRRAELAAPPFPQSTRLREP